MNAVPHPFSGVEQQREAAKLGMWIFLATEVLFFGGLFAGYAAYRFLYPEAFQEGSHHMDLTLGAANTAVLLTSSCTMALSLGALHAGRTGRALALLGASFLLGLIFLGIKAVEYRHHVLDHLFPGSRFQFEGELAGPVELFFWLYFTMTGLHALHVIIGVGVIGAMAWLVQRGRVNRERFLPLEVAGLYWHFVDIVWVYLFPLLYLAGVRG